jgi:hypothetical protein
MADPNHTPPPELMFKLITGYWVSQAIGVAADLAIADRLAEHPASADELAQATAVEPHALFRLLRTLSAVGVFRATEAGRFVLTPLGETLRSNVPGSMRDFAVAQTREGHWLPWGKLSDAVRTGQRQTVATLGGEIFEHYAKMPKEAAAFSGAMNNLASLVAGEAARAIDTSHAKVVVDVGGANGTLLAALLRANPALSGVLFDLPHVIGGARAAMEAHGYASRCEIVGGDFFASVPAGDVYLLKQILHDWDDDQSIRILQNCARAMNAGGRLFVVEMVIPDDGRPSPAQFMDLNMLVMLPGKERTRSEYAALFERAGLRFVRLIETHSPFQLVEALRA